MNEKEITKPSLTQRRKITGSTKISDEPSLKPMMMGEDMDSSDDISIVKVAGVIVAVVVVAIIAAFLIINLQSSGDNEPEDTQQEETKTTPTPTTKPTTTPEETSDTTPTPTPAVTKTPSDSGDTTTQPGSFGQGSQSLSSSATAADYKIRTYQWINASGYYEFNLPVERTAGTSDNPGVKASYNDGGDLILEVENINLFSSCSYLNENNSNMSYGNVNKVSCEKQGNKFVFTIDTITKTDFKLSYEEREIALNGEKASSVVVQIKNK